MDRETYNELESVFSDLYQPQRFKEKMFFVFQDVPNKIEFIEKVEREFLPTLKDRRNGNINLGEYGRNRMMLYDDAIEFIDKWLKEKKRIYKLMEPEQVKEEQTDPQEIENPHPKVFTSDLGYTLFEKLHNDYKGGSTPLADYSFVYRRMVKDGYIYKDFRPRMFENWLSKNYDIHIENMKQLHRCKTTAKETNYDNSLELIKKTTKA